MLHGVAPLYPITTLAQRDRAVKKQVRLIHIQKDRWVELRYGGDPWRLLVNFRFWFISYFATGNYLMGLLGLVLIVGVIGVIALSGDDPGAQAIGALLALVYVVVGLFSAGGADRRIGRNYLRKGWVFAEPESEAAQKAKRSWRV